MSFDPTSDWFDTYRAQGLAKALLAGENSGYDEYPFDFGSWRDFVFEAGSTSPAATSPADGGGAWRIANAAGQQFNCNVRSTLTTTLPKFAVGRKKWYVAVRFRVTSPVVFPLVTNETVHFRLPSTVGDVTRPTFGMLPTISLSKWVFQYTGLSVLSTKDLSNLWTTLEIWNDGTLQSMSGTIKGQVTDSLGTEAPVSVGGTFADASLESIGFGIFAGGSLSGNSPAGNGFIMDKALILNQILTP